MITEGHVRISKVVPGVGEEALTILGPGEFFGEVEFFDGGPASAHAIAHADCEVLAIPHREMRGLLRSRPGLAAKFLWAFGRTLAAAPARGQPEDGQPSRHLPRTSERFRLSHAAASGFDMARAYP